MLLSSILIVFCFMFSLLNIRTPVRTLKMTKKNSKSGLYDPKDLDVFDIVLYNFGLRKHWRSFLGITEKDGKQSIKQRWYLKNLTKMSYGSDGPVFKPDIKGILTLVIPIVLNLILIYFVPVSALGLPFVGFLPLVDYTSVSTGDWDDQTKWNDGS